MKTNAPVLLVTIDSLRYDVATEAMSRTRARLDSWHEAAFATCPATMGSVPAILSGDRPQDAGLPSGASVFTTFDCPTVGITTNRLLAASYGYDDGFDTYRAPASAQESSSLTTKAAAALDTGTMAYDVASRLWSVVQLLQDRVPRTAVPKSYRPADEVVDEFLSTLPARNSPATEFEWAGWLHLMDPHHPYDPAPASRAADQAVTRRLINGRGDDTDANRARDRYHQEVAQVDDAVARLLDAIPETARVIVTADHGECLGEGGTWGHQGDLRPATLRVPFGTRGITVDSPVVSLRDVPAYLHPAREPPAREHALAAYGDETAVATDDLIVGPAGAWTLDGEPTRPPRDLDRLRSTDSNDTVTLADANTDDLRALGYL